MAFANCSSVFIDAFSGNYILDVVRKMKDDSNGQAGVEIEVTDAMIKAGVDAFVFLTIAVDPSEVVRELVLNVFCAMARSATTSQGEPHALPQSLLSA